MTDAANAHPPLGCLEASAGTASRPDPEAQRLASRYRPRPPTHTHTPEARYRAATVRGARGDRGLHTKRCCRPRLVRLAPFRSPFFLVFLSLGVVKSSFGSSELVNSPMLAVRYSIFGTCDLGKQVWYFYFMALFLLIYTASFRAVASPFRFCRARVFSRGKIILSPPSTHLQYSVRSIRSRTLLFSFFANTVSLFY